jgi:hypothetical protein
VGTAVGLAYLVSDTSEQPPITKILMSVGVGATATFFSSLFFPVRIKDVLTFEEPKGLGNFETEPVRVILPDGVYNGYMQGYHVTLPEQNYQFDESFGVKCGMCKIPVQVTVQNGLATTKTLR